MQPGFFKGLVVRTALGVLRGGLVAKDAERCGMRAGTRVDNPER
jgi:hypothetical protein